MAQTRAGRFDRESLARAGALVAVCTLVLTASFVGLVALVSGATVDLSSRLPMYVLAMATAFVGTIIYYEMQSVNGVRVLASAGAIALGTFVVGVLGGEGVVHTLRHPEQVIASQLLVYLLAAGMIATGLGYWGVKHWQDLPRSISGVASTTPGTESGSGRGL